MKAIWYLAAILAESATTEMESAEMGGTGFEFEFYTIFPLCESDYFNLIDFCAT
jgi:hypothetical protein